MSAIRRPSNLIASIGLLALACCGSEAPVGLTGIRLSAEAVDFGTVAVGSIKTEIVRIENVGDEVVVLGAVERGAELDPSFFFALPNREVSPGQSSALEVSFEPERNGDAGGMAFIKLASDDKTPRGLQLSGRGVFAPLLVRPTNFMAAPTVVGSTRTTTIALENRGPDAIEVDVAFVDGIVPCNRARTEVFCLRDEAPIPLAPGEVRTIGIEFTPALFDAPEQATLRFQSCEADGCTIDVSMSGNGIESGLSCTPERLDFGAVNLNSCTTGNVVCDNIANETIAFDRVAFDAGSSSAFRLVAPGPAILAAGARAVIGVEYCPLGVAQNQGALSIETSAPAAGSIDVQVALAGRGGGPNIRVTPTSIDVGEVSLLAPVMAEFVIENIGDRTLTVPGIEVDREGTNAVSAISRGPWMLAPGARQAVSLSIQPESAGPLMSSVVVLSDDRDSSEIIVPIRAVGVSLAPCRYEIIPRTLEFGDVQTGLPVRRAVLIRNIGGDDCLFRDFSIASDSDVSIDRPLGNSRVPRGEALFFNLEMSGTHSGPLSGTLDFAVSDPVEPSPSLPISGNAGAAMQIVYPDELDFGPTTASCDLGATRVRILNPTDQTITITSARISGADAAAFRLVPSAFPMSLSPDGVASVEVSFAVPAVPTEYYVATLEVLATVGGQPRTTFVSLTGRTAASSRRVDRFESSSRLDLLLSLEHTFGTAAARTGMTTGLSTMFEQATTAQIDFHAAVTTGDLTIENGEFLGAARPVVTNTTPTPATTLSGNMTGRTESGFNGIGWTTFEAARRAIAPPLVTGGNAGFLRDDARLSLLFLAKSPERSTGTVERYVDLFRRTKGYHRRHLVSASVAAGDSPSGCSGPSGFAQAGPRYFEFAERLAGGAASFCTVDWPNTMATLADDLIGRRARYQLYGAPVPGSIEVSVDGVVVPSAGSWQYDVLSNEVRFDLTSRPPLGADVEIAYEQTCR